MPDDNVHHASCSEQGMPLANSKEPGQDIAIFDGQDTTPGAGATDGMKTIFHIRLQPK